MKNFQRDNSTSNTSAGNKFEDIILSYFNKPPYNFELTKRMKVEIGTSAKPKKNKVFDLGKEGKILIECKSHKWTEAGHLPSAKIAVWNEAMYLFSLVKGYRKLFVVEKFINNRKDLSLANYYLQKYTHLIPKDVEVWEFDTEKNIAEKLI